jgi:hypothetical protein
MTTLHQVRHLARDGPRYVLDGLGVLRLGQALEALVLGGVEVTREVTGHGEELVLDHAIHVVMVDALDHEPVGVSCCLGEGRDSR